MVKHLGYFRSATSAHKAWQQAKSDLLSDMIQSYQQHTRLVQGLTSIYEKLEGELRNNIVTTNLLLPNVERVDT